MEIVASQAVGERERERARERERERKATSGLCSSFILHSTEESSLRKEEATFLEATICDVRTSAESIHKY